MDHFSHRQSITSTREGAEHGRATVHAMSTWLSLGACVGGWTLDPPFHQEEEHAVNVLMASVTRATFATMPGPSSFSEGSTPHSRCIQTIGWRIYSIKFSRFASILRSVWISLSDAPFLMNLGKKVSIEQLHWKYPLPKQTVPASKLTRRSGKCSDSLQ